MNCEWCLEGDGIVIGEVMMMMIGEENTDVSGLIAEASRH